MEKQQAQDMVDAAFERKAAPVAVDEPRSPMGATQADPYGWIAAVEADRSTVDNSLGEQVPVRPEHVVVWTDRLENGPDKFDYAVAKVLPNGTLLITRPGSDIPLKGYAPGSWLTFEHVGEKYHTRPVQVRPTERRPAFADTVIAGQEQTASEELSRVLTDPNRRTPPTFEADADDTQNLPSVEPDTTDMAADGGGVGRPKARGVRPDAGYDGHPDRHSIYDLGIPAPLSDLTDPWTLSGAFKAVFRRRES